MNFGNWGNPGVGVGDARGVGRGVAPLPAPLDSCLPRNDEKGAGMTRGGWGMPGVSIAGLPRPWIPAFAGMEAEGVGDCDGGWLWGGLPHRPLSIPLF